MPSPTHVLSLIAASDAAPIAPAQTEATRAEATRAEAWAPAGAERWLSPGRAWELPVSVPDGTAARAALEALRQQLDQRRIDANLVAHANRRKRLLVADMDSTMVEQESLDELADAVGAGDRVAAITARAMAGELDFAAALKERIALIAGTPAALLDDVAATLAYVPGGAALVATMRAAGAHTALVSGGFVEIVGHAARTLGFHEFQANRFQTDAGRIVGVAEPILDKDAKLQALQRLAAAHGLSSADALTVGDGANDVPMLAAAGLGVAFRAKPRVRAQVPVQVTHADLTALLYLQGYGDNEISRSAH